MWICVLQQKELSFLQNACVGKVSMQPNGWHGIQACNIISPSIVECCAIWQEKTDEEGVEAARDLAVLKLQDMYEVVTRDMMTEPMR
jgi:hypothetical protein